MSQLENLEGVLGLILSALFLGLSIVIAAASRERPKRALREIPAITRLRRAVGLAVDAGTRLHVSLGSGDLTGLPGSSALAGMAML